MTTTGRSEDPQVAALRERLTGLEVDPLLSAHGAFRLSKGDANLIIGIVQQVIAEALEPMRRAAEGSP